MLEAVEVVCAVLDEVEEVVVNVVCDDVENMDEEVAPPGDAANR